MEIRAPAPIPEGLSAQDFAGRCARCTNTYDCLYIRRDGARLCIHCVQLEATGKVHTGRGGGRRGQDELRPYHQPPVVLMHSPKPIFCVWCEVLAYPIYSLYGHQFHACGWAHAGLWMDWVSESLVNPERAERELQEGLEYVKKSLGLPDGIL